MLFVCTDLDRTLIPNGNAPESSLARPLFHNLADLEEITLAYVTGRDLQLVEQAIEDHALPKPQYILADVGSSVYIRDGERWRSSSGWRGEMNRSWDAKRTGEVIDQLKGLPGLNLQEEAKQTEYKISWYVSLAEERHKVIARVEEVLAQIHIHHRLVYSVDELENTALLDILPENVSKRHAVEYVMDREGFALINTVFAGDSGNDLDVLLSPIPSVVVKNANEEFKKEVVARAVELDLQGTMYLARGNFHGLNGNYGGGILEGVCHYHPWVAEKLFHDG